jgi:hypothetical protein
MICPRCNNPTSRLIIKRGVTACADCRGLSETGGARVSGILTRNSERVRAQQHTYEGDTITPHVYDRVLGRLVPNEAFMERFPEQIGTYFTAAELKKAGYSKPDAIFEAKAKVEAEADAEREKVEFVEDTDGEGMKEMVDAL